MSYLRGTTMTIKILINQGTGTLVHAKELYQFDLSLVIPFPFLKIF